jgi:hypothetical protein
MKVSVYHNESARFFRVYEAGDDIAKVHEFEAEPPTSDHEVRRLLSDAYERYNIGTCDDACAYRGIRFDGVQVTDDGSGKAIHHDGRVYGIRSLSVGDVLVVGEVAYSVAPIGWDRVSLDATDPVAQVDGLDLV